MTLRLAAALSAGGTTAATIMLAVPARADVDTDFANQLHTQCITVKTGESLTFGGGCNTATCTSTIWSAATPDLPGTTQYKKGMKQLGQPVDFPRTCPTPTSHP